MFLLSSCCILVSFGLAKPWAHASTQERRQPTPEEITTAPAAGIRLAAASAATVESDGAALDAGGGEGGTAPSRDIEQLMSMSLAELLNTPVAVASTRKKTVFNTPSTVGIVDRKMLDLYNFQTVAEAVNAVSGFGTVKTTSRIDLPTSRWILQAHYANKVLVMINGIPTWMPSTGETTLGRIDIDQVERIEILRGPASVLYGTNAYAGAVNIVLRSPAADDTAHRAVTVGASSAYGIRGSGRLTLDKEKLQVFAAASTYDERGTLREATDADDPPVHGRYQDFRDWINAVLNVKYGEHALLLNPYREYHTKFGRDPTFAAGWGEPQYLDGVLANYTYARRIAELVDVNAGATFDWNRKLFARNAGYNERTEVVGWRGGGFVKGIIDLGEFADIELGVDFDHRASAKYRNYLFLENDTLSDSNLRDRSIWEASVFSQLGIEYASLGLLAGARFTRNELFGNNVATRASAVYAFTEHNAVKLIWGQSYRAPSLFELYYLLPSSRTLSGNPDVEPETSDSLELAYVTSFSGVFLQALVYRGTYAGNIFRTTVPVGTILADGQPSTVATAKQYVNGGEFSANGAEVELRYENGPLNVFAAYTFVDGDKGDIQPGTDHYNFKYVPQHKVVGGAAVSFAGAHLSISGGYLSEMRGPVAGPDGTDVIDPQFKLDLSAGYDHRWGGTRLRHVVSVKNLTNEDTQFPEYVDLELRSIPWDLERRFYYSLTIEL